VAPNVASYPSAAFDGTHYFVIFSVVGFAPPAGIYDARVTTSGSLLDHPPNQLGPSIAERLEAGLTARTLEAVAPV